MPYLEEQTNEAAERTLFEAARVSIASKHDRMEAESFIRLVHVVGYRSGRYDDGERYASLAEAVIDRMGGDDELRSNLAAQRGHAALVASKLDVSERHYRQELALRERVFGPEHYLTAQAMQDIAFAMHDREPLREVLAYQERVVTTLERALGDRHPRVGSALQDVALTKTEMGEYDA